MAKTALGAARPRQSPFEPDTETIIILVFLLDSTTALGASPVYRYFFKRIKTANWATLNLLELK
jgi:hypothetical protein